MDSENGNKKRKSSVSAEDELTDAGNEASAEADVERVLPLFPTDEFVLFPSAMIILTVDEKHRVDAIREAMREDGSIFILSLPSMKTGIPSNSELLDSIGIVGRVIKASPMPGCDSGLQVTIHGKYRATLNGMRLNGNGVFMARNKRVEDIPLAIIGEAVYEDQSLLRAVRQSARSFMEAHGAGRDLKDILKFIDQSREPGSMCDFLGGHLDMPHVVRMQLLQTISVRHRLQILLNVFAAQNEASVIYKDAAQRVRSDIDKQQREYFVRQHIKALRDQIQDKEPDPSREEDELVQQIKDLDASDEVKAYVEKQFKRMSYLPLSSAEYSVARAHIEVLIDMPWRLKTEDHLNLADARRILDEDHYGLKDVKERVIEHLAVLSLRKDLKSPILCLYGPPGVGKTSIGKSIARALGRKFERISLGGIHDEAEIRGHRRTYVASMPGRIVQALRHAKSMNPVIMLDEIDKLTKSMQGDPASALLEVLDPEQHNAFVDNYIETPIDLSDVLFITTANSLDTIPGPLRDRMEIIELPSYTHIDKRCIAKDFLIPKVLSEHGLVKSNLSMKDDAIDEVIERYTREAGVRQLQQRLSSLCRKAAARVVEGREQGKKRVRVTVSRKNLESFLGKPRYDIDMIEPDRLPGISTGLAWTPVGGDILFIETTDMPGKGELVLTGQLGDVMKESVRAAMTLIRARAQNLGIDSEILSKRDVHVHFPAGAVPKDGPSAGAAIFTALLSLFKDEPVPATLAMTGEISLRGNILPVGGIREKVLAAHRSGIRTILLPAKNERDLEDVPEVVRNDLEFHLIRTIDEVVEFVFGNK